MLNCSVRLGHLLTCSTCGALSGSPSITPPRAWKGANLSSFTNLVISLARLTMSSPPQQMAAVPVKSANKGASGVPSVARAAMLFLTTITWMFLRRSSARSRVLVLASKPTTFTNSASWTFCNRPRRCSATKLLTYLLMSHSLGQMFIATRVNNVA